MDTHAGRDARIKPRVLPRLLENKRVAARAACVHAQKQIPEVVQEWVVKWVLNNPLKFLMVQLYKHRVDEGGRICKGPYGCPRENLCISAIV